MAKHTSIEPGVNAVMKNLKSMVSKEFGYGWGQLGTRIQGALLSERLVILCVQQDESVPAERVRLILDQGRSWIIEEVNR
jgi:hypothetical protein